MSNKETIHRISTLELIKREEQLEQRIVTGIVCPFNAPTPIQDRSGRYTEVINRGAFTKTITERSNNVKLMANHNYQINPVGVAISLEERDEGLYGEFKISRTAAGDEVLELVRDGALDAFSIGAIALRSVRSAENLVERKELKLNEVSLVPFPAYEGAKVMALRDATFEPATTSLAEVRAYLEGRKAA